MGKFEVISESQSCSTALKRILICGLGSIGQRHARILHHNFPDIELSVWRSGHGAECPELSLMSHHFLDLDAAIRWNPDAAFICSPAPFHQHQALSLIRQKIPVLIEKPVGIGSEPQEGWDELLQHSQTVPVVIGYLLRHDPCAEYLKNKIDSGEFGKVLDADFYCGSWLPDWRPNSDYRSCVSGKQSMGGGVLLELSHEIDLARWLLDDFKITFASLKQSGLLDVDVEDQALITGSGSKCSLISIRLNFCSRPSRRNIIVRCEKGEINWDLLNGKVDLYTSDQELHRFNPCFQSDDRIRVQTERFLECIYSQKAPHCSLNDGLAVMKLINQIKGKACIEKTVLELHDD